jgi:hypothetical protein
MNRVWLSKKAWLTGLGVIGFVGIVFTVAWALRPQAPQVDLKVTQAYQTVAARLTEASQTTASPDQADSASLTAVAPAVATFIPTHTATRTPTLSPTQAPDQPDLGPSPTLPCDRAAAGNPIDITVPDESEFRPGQAFTKIWRLQNIGACTWSREYAAQFFYGDRMGAPELVYLGREVTPGQVVEIAVDLTAPADPGTYQGNWKLRNNSGILFGIGPKGDAPFWVRIVVIRVATPTSTPTITPTPTLTFTPVLTATPTATPTPPVASGGDLALLVDQTVDLDLGKVSPEGGRDLSYLLDAGFHLLAPQSGAVLGVFGSSEPGLPACQSAGMSPVPIALESLSPGTYLCYLTDEGRSGWLRYDRLDPQDGSAALAYRTWVNLAVP